MTLQYLIFNPHTILPALPDSRLKTKGGNKIPKALEHPA